MLVLQSLHPSHTTNDFWGCNLLIQLYKPLESDTETFAGNKLGDITKVTSLTFKDKLENYGSFTLNVPKSILFVDKIIKNTLLYVDYDYWLIVKGIVDVGNTLEITGFNLKSLLADRITLYGLTQGAGTTGYDVVQGSTETVIKHYIANNLTSPTDPNRKIVGLEIATDQHRGLATDTYMSRFELVNEAVEKICKNAKIGYDIKVDLATNKMIFDVIVGEDKSESQSERNRVIFAVDRNNVASARYETNISTGKNAFYSTKSGGGLETDAVTQLVFREDTILSGINRREMHLNVSCDSVSDIATYAKKDMESYEDTDSFEIDVKGFAEYGDIYKLGDIVTVRNDTVSLDTIITEAETSYSGVNKSLKLTFGNKKPKLLNQISKQINNKGV